MPSTIDILNFTQQWSVTLQKWHLEYFLIPTTLITLVTFLANLALLTCIFMSRALRQETRYLLLANTLTADVLFLILNLATVICNAVRTQMPWMLCQLVTAGTITAYCCAIITITLMVVDTYAAVRWPLWYHGILPHPRIHCILVGVWLLAAIYPFALMIKVEVKRENSHENIPVCLILISLGIIQAEKVVMGIHIYFFVAALICAVLILYCYIRLYMVTRTQGIWKNRFSRARVTMLAHGILLLLYFAPGFVFILELFLFQAEQDQDVRVWISTVNMCVFTLLPRAFAPFLYGLRYREISDTLMQLLQQHRSLRARP
uniref:probable G-protein coupled receptor 148 isoform X2 n=1 Tax=Monopterus albus TaxID=43700 RepID=UPI0009B4CE91|nr:transcription termination factor 4, mitochondrial isoform X2 [Monopterus albus]